jgi:hypothetical protein
VNGFAPAEEFLKELVRRHEAFRPPFVKFSLNERKAWSAYVLDVMIMKKSSFGGLSDKYLADIVRNACDSVFEQIPTSAASIDLRSILSSALKNYPNQGSRPFRHMTNERYDLIVDTWLASPSSFDRISSFRSTILQFVTTKPDKDDTDDFLARCVTTMVATYSIPDFLQREKRPTQQKSTPDSEISTLPKAQRQRLEAYLLERYDLFTVSAWKQIFAHFPTDE